MADHRALAVTCEAVARLLESAYDAALFDGTELRFDVFRTPDFKNPPEAGVTIYLYRVYPNAGMRNPPSRRTDGVRRRLPQLPLDAHFLVTAWARRSSLEHTVLGWAMRVLEDRPMLPASLLNGVMSGVFDPDETVDVVPGELSVEDMARLWDGLPADYQPSVPYIARVVRIESLLDPPSGAPITERHLEFAT